MELQEPFTFVINKKHPRKLGVFKVDTNNTFDSYLMCAGVQTFGLNNIKQDNYLVITGEDVIPFIIHHNKVVRNLINDLKISGHGGKYNLMTISRNAIIENELNTDITIQDIIKDTCDDCNDELLIKEYLNEIMYDYLVNKVLEKYEYNHKE